MTTWIQTFSGQAFDLADPQPDMVKLTDIAHALSNVCRYTGHCSAFYSVAQHSCHVADCLPPHLKLQGLLHDATEAYVADLSRPLKQLLPEYKIIENRVWTAIAAHFGLPEKLAPEVKHADNVVLMIERAALLGPQPAPWAPELEALCSSLPFALPPAWSPALSRASFLAYFDVFSGVKA